jgi:hypothetical protein
MSLGAGAAVLSGCAKQSRLPQLDCRNLSSSLAKEIASSAKNVSSQRHGWDFKKAPTLVKGDRTIPFSRYNFSTSNRKE